MTAMNWEHPFNFDVFFRRVAPPRFMAGRGRHRFGPGGPDFGGPGGPGGPGGGFRGGPFMGPLFGGMPGGFGRRTKARRGDVRMAALLLLAEEPRNGYQIMQELEERSEGMWRPSPGSVYPALQQLEDEGLIGPKGPGGRRPNHLTTPGGPTVGGGPTARPHPGGPSPATLGDSN